DPRPGGAVNQGRRRPAGAAPPPARGRAGHEAAGPGRSEAGSSGRSKKTGTKGQAPADSLARAIEDYLEHLKVERRLRPNSLLAYAGDLQVLCEHATAAGVTETEAVTPALLLRFVVALAQAGLSPRSQARRLT